MLKITKNLEFKDFSTLKLGNGSFSKLYEIESISDFEEFLEDNNGQEFFVLGTGSNTVFVQENPNLNILRININDINIFEENGIKKIKSGAGIGWDDLVVRYIAEGGIGMESLSASPGTVGAAPVQNIGAYGHDVSEFIDTVYVYDLKEEMFKEMKAPECEFSYRNSKFKNEKGRFIIFYVTFNVVNGEVKVPEYKDVINYFAQKGNISDTKDLWKSGDLGKIENKTTIEIREAIVAIRKMKFPDIHEIPNCGSFFENPIISKAELEKVKSVYPDIPVFPVENMKTEGVAESEYVKIPLGYILERLGYKGKEIGNFAMYKNHALILTQNKNANVKEFKDFIENIKSEVFEKTGVKISIEVNLV